MVGLGVGEGVGAGTTAGLGEGDAVLPASHSLPVASSTCAHTVEPGLQNKVGDVWGLC